MPALPLRDIPIWQIIAFLRSKQNESNFERPDGVVEQGRRLFVQHKCDSCHWTRRSGGRLGPDLSQWRGDMEFFRRAMRHPDEEIDPKYQRVSARLEDGRLLVGRRLYDDGYFLLLIDEQQNLHTIPLFEIEELVLPKQSLMASYANELDEQALRDLAAYTYSLSEKTMP
jgi:putative heme-binding domain-containing protein